MGRLWTDAEWLIVITSRAAGIRYAEIAKQLPGRTARQIKDRVSWVNRGKNKRGHK